jgi:hypothetical protein
VTGFDAHRQTAVDLVSPTPADGERTDVEVRTYRQGIEGALAEDPDTGLVSAEQRRGVERNAQPRPVRPGGRAVGAQVVIAPSMERIAPVT